MNKVTLESIKDKIIARMFTRIPETTITLCVLTLANGYTVTGESACADPANYNEELGQFHAEEAAIDKIWPLEGYLLKEKLHAESGSFADRVILERYALDEKIGKLATFIDGGIFAGLPEEDRTLLHEQLDAMRHYSYLLGKRLDRLIKPA